MARLFIQSGIYQFINLNNKKIYVGSSKDLLWDKCKNCYNVSKEVNRNSPPTKTYHKWKLDNSK